ncbi:MAG TPA: 23S rRNA (uracil(1939)-C(5))-methyltransferase RlmD [bacterium]|nr:23S rRNA (uracil(1939)-C(5))-methyltransferase RlmD [bacterium]
MPLRPTDEVDIRIDRMSYGGRGVGRVDGFVVFVDDAAPGDRLRARLRKVKKSYGEAHPVRIVEPSAERTEPRCPHFGPCGGCLWQHLDYAAQLRAKQAIVEESLRHLGGLEPAPVRPIIGPDDPWYYRNKMEFSFHPGGRLGLHRRGRWDEIVDLHTCFLQSPRTAEILNEVRAFVLAEGIACYDPRTHEGLLRHLVIREGRGTGELLIAVVTASEAFPQARALAVRLAERHPELTGFIWAVNPSKGDAVEVAGFHVLHGRPHITERLGGLTFKLGLLTFFQTNTAQAERMVAIVREMAGRGVGHALDLYSGVGTFALALAGQAERVTGIEVVAASVEAARENAALNGIANAAFHTADVRRFDQVPGVGGADLLVLDPPRAGAGVKVMQAIARLGPPRVIYISCNPTTLAPDLRELAAAGYAVRAVQPIDLFPHTYHVECIVLLDRAA